MIKKYFNKRQQISENHCGPAVLQMMLDLVGVSATQEQITEAAGAASRLEELGTRVDQLALACEKLAPYFCLWQKQPTTLEEIKTILDNGYLVAVEWQGLFYDSVEEEEPGNDYGHYSIVLNVNSEDRTITIVDPYKDFQDADRVFSVDFFLGRWWDTNKVLNSATGIEEEVKDVNLAFFVAPKDEQLAKSLGFSYEQFEGVEPYQTQEVSSLEIRKQRIASLLRGKLRKVGS